MDGLKLKERKWYWFSSGCGMSDSTLVSPYQKTGKKDGGYYNLSASMANGGELKPMPLTDEWVAIGLNGRKVTISANQLKDAGHIGIGTIEERPDAKLYLYREDAQRIIKSGYTEDDVCSLFGTSWRDGSEDGTEGSGDLTDKMLEMLSTISIRKDEEEALEKVEADRRYNEAFAEWKKKLDYLPCKKTGEHDWLTAGETSRNLRAILKHEFPNVKFTVHSSTYSGGDSVRVGWVDGPSYEAVKGIVEQFESCSFDGMQDLEETFHTAFHAVAGDFSYTHCNREISQGFKDKVRSLLITKGYRPDYDRLNYEVADILERTDLSRGEIVDLEWVEEKDGEYYAKYDVVFKEAEHPHPDNTGRQIVCVKVEVTENTEKNGIEIRFSEKPSSDVLDDLKRNGWRWTRFGKCWYARATEKNRKYALSLAA